MGASQALVQRMGDRLDLEWPAVAACRHLTARCMFRDGTVHESGCWEAGGTARRFRAACGPLSVELELQPADGCVRMRVEATATDAVDVAYVALAAQPALAASSLDWVLYNGFQSWDAAGCLPANGHARHSWWTIGLGDARGGGIAAAAVEARRCCTKFTVEDGVLSTLWREAESLEPWPTLFSGPPGTIWRSEEVVFSVGPDVRACLAGLLTSSPRPWPAPIGWLSWYHFGPWVSRQDVLAAADLLAGDGYRGLGYRLVQLDDGWQQTYGEWLPNTKFPGGLPALCDEVRRRGQVPGLWTAPFLVGVAADLATRAPDDWFVLDPETGERAVDPRHRAFGPMYVLDGSRPAVQEYLRELFAGFYEAGVRYFKVDFLYAGAYAGVGALRAGLEAIREGVGDAAVVASGAPLLPMVGLVEGCRIGPDTATPLYDFETGVSSPTTFGDEVLAVARNVAARSTLQRWFQLDADVALVGGNLSLEQGRQLATLAALSGGPFLASDDLVNLPPERLALLTNPEVLDLVGGLAAQPDWEPDGKDGPATHWRRGDVLAVFNWGAEPADIAVRATGARGARDLWQCRDLDRFEDGSVLHVPAHGVRLLRLI